MLEEFRVSLFAQHLGTRQAVSEKRLREQWDFVSRWLDQNPH
jgi:ATP-dependent helicase HrpA